MTILIVGAVLAPARPAAAAGVWSWPVTGPLSAAFDPPDSPYSAGHRGIDIVAPVGAAVSAPRGGTVTFAGRVAGQLYLTIDHGGGVVSTASWLSAVLVTRGDAVSEGQLVARTGWGHPTATSSHLHFSVRLDGAYVDPLDYLASVDVTNLIRLAPLTGSPPATVARAYTMARPWTPLLLPAAVVAVSSVRSWPSGWAPP